MNKNKNYYFFSLTKDGLNYRTDNLNITVINDILSNITD